MCWFLLFSNGKDTKMNEHMHAKEQFEVTVNMETAVTESDELVEY